MFLADPETEAIIMIGEIGGAERNRRRRVPRRQQGEEADGGLHRRRHRPAGPAHGPCRRGDQRRARHGGGEVRGDAPGRHPCGRQPGGAGQHDAEGAAGLSADGGCAALAHAGVAARRRTEHEGERPWPASIFSPPPSTAPTPPSSPTCTPAGSPIRAAVDPGFAELFAALNDESRAILEDNSGASWAPRTWQFGEPDAAKPAPPAGGQGPPREGPPRRPAADRRAGHRRAGARRHQGQHPRADDDPHLPGARPSGSEARPARPAGAGAASRTRPGHLRLHRRRHGPADLHRQRAGPGDRHRRGRSCRCCARPIAARSASSSCISRIPTRRPGSSAGWKARPGGRISTPPASERILHDLTEAEGLEAFCQKRYVGTKRFGLEGGEVTIPALHAIIEVGAPQRRERDRHRHAASRPAEHAGQRGEEAATRRCSANSAAPASSPTTCRARAT